MGREPAWGCGLPRRGRHTRYAWSESLWDGPATREGRRAKEREADQVACHNLSGTPPGWEGREARRGRRSECLRSSLLAPFDAANNIPWLTYRQYRVVLFFTSVNSSCCLHNPTLLVGILLKKKTAGSSRLPLWVAPDGSLFCTAYQALLHIARDVLRIEGKLV